MIGYYMGATKKAPAPAPAVVPDMNEPPTLTMPVPVPDSYKKLAVYTALGMVSLALLYWMTTNIGRKR
jgi:hypothetical protein